MFCQSCGSKNSPDARFCNMCGTPIASPGTPAGLVEPDAEAPTAPPPAMSHTSSITLARLGVQSSGRAWGTLLGIAFGLVALGSLATFAVMRGDGGEGGGEALAGPVQADDPFVLGTPLPSGVEPPSDEGFVARQGDARAGTGSEEGRARGRANAAGRVRRSAAPTTTAGGGEQGGGVRESGDASASVGAAAGVGESGGASAAGGEGAGAGEMAVPEDRDIAMELYGARVRFVIRRYYAQRAQSCFDRATRNNPGLRGTVVVGLRVGADGQVAHTDVARNTTGDDALGACLANQVRSWKLPPPPEGPRDLELPFSR